MKHMKANDEAVAGVVVAVMIVGLVLAVISIIQTIYLPKWMETREAEHMGVVADQFSQLKFAIDSQAALKENVPISTSITLGSRELGFFMSNKAFGRLSLDSNNWGYRIIRTPGDTFEDTLGILQYASENSYFLDQNYIYEIGGVILNQSEGAVFLIKPEFSASYNTSDRTVDLAWTCVDIQPKDEKVSISGYGTYPVRTEYVATTNNSITAIHSITIVTSYSTIWYNFLNSTLSSANLQRNTHYLITKSPYDVTVTFLSPPLTDVTLDFEKVIISTQITPGWVE
jgi:hypothetical protein